MKENKLLRLSGIFSLLFILLSFNITKVHPADNNLAAKLFKEGEKYYANKKYPQAIDKFRKFIMNYPAHPDAPRSLYLLGSSYKNMGKTKLALDRYRMFLDYYPYAKEMPSCLYEMGRIYEEKKDYDASIIPYKLIVSHYRNFPELPYCEYKLTLIPYYKLGRSPSLPQLDSIIKNLTEVMDKYPEHPLYEEAKTAWISCQVKKADIYFSRDQWQEARKSYKLLLRKYPEYEQKDYLLFRIPYTHNMERKFDKAVSGYKKILREFPKSSWADDACERLASIYSGFLNKPDKAIYYLKKIKDEYPKADQAIRAVWILASMYEGEGRYKEAIDCYYWLIKIDPKSTSAYKAKAEIRRLNKGLKK